MGYIGQAPTKVPLTSADITDGTIAEADIANDAVNFVTHLKAGTDGELITWDASGNPAAVPVGTSTHVLTSGGTGVAPTFQAASGGDLRNYIIDGGMTSFPEGTSITGATDGVHGPALCMVNDSSTAVYTLSQSTDIPTYAQSGHQGKYSWKTLFTTADASLGAGDYIILLHRMTGSNVVDLHGGKNVTMSFWAKFDADGSSSTSAPYSFSVSIMNSAKNRSYIKELSMAADNDWQKFEFTFPTDTTGTWLFTEADRGWQIGICMGTGSTYHGTDETWEAARDYATSNQENFSDQANNAFYLTQVGLYIGDSAPTFTGESVATINDQVGYYIERYGHATAQRYMNVGWGYSTTSPRLVYHYTYKKRTAAPTTTISGDVYFGGHATSSETFNTKSSSRVMIYCVASSIVVNEADEFHLNGGAYITIDSRH